MNLLDLSSSLAAYLVIVLYAVILGLVAPYITVHAQKYGSLLPPAIALASGSLLWAVLTWVGLPYTNAYIWIIVMVLMPIAMMIGSSTIARMRDAAEAEEAQFTR